MGVAGDPDLYGSYHGRHFEIEVKRPNDPRAVLTKLQAERLREWNVDGKAIVGVARSPEEALAILGLLKPDVVWLCGGCRQYRWQGDDPPARCPKCGHLHFEREAPNVG
jgi:rubrerythrin